MFHRLHNRILTAFAVMVAAIVMAVSVSYAWYYIDNSTDMNAVHGVVTYVAKYFESGNGTTSAKFIDDTSAGEDDRWGDYAFEIKTPEQLYNLAWLQYLGYFNTDSDESASGTQVASVYFYLSEDLDMKDYILPPIGTTDNPFLGHFDGCGHTISNLTVANTAARIEESEISQLPYSMRVQKIDTISGVEIVGLFGVVGDYDGTYSYDTSTNEITNLKIENITVETQTTDSLAGLAAGYVNGTLSDVTVSGKIDGAAATSGVTVGSSTTDKLSNYTTVGYCTETYRSTLDVAKVEHTLTVETGSYEATDDGNAWGGSIRMNELFFRLRNTVNNGKTYVAQHYTTATRKYSRAEGSSEYTQTDISYGNPVTTGYNRTYYFYNYDWDGYAKYSFDDDSQSTSAQYECLYGADNTYGPSNTMTVTNEYSTIYKTFKLKHGSTYLNLTEGGGITGGTSAEDATGWAYVTYGQAGTAYYLVTNYNGTIYYLSVGSDGAVTTTINVSSATTWDMQTTDDGVTVCAGKKYLYYDEDGDAWKTKAFAATFKAKSDRYTSYYINVATNTYGIPSGTVTAGTSGSTTWTFDGTYIYTTVSEVNYYLNVGNNSSLSVGTSPSTVWYYDETNGYFYYNNGSRKYYLAIQRSGRSGSYSCSVTTETYYAIKSDGWSQTVDTGTVTLEKSEAEDTLTFVNYTASTTETGPYITNDSIFPITIDQTAADGTYPSGGYTTSTKNTGYFVSGADHTEYWGNLRVSKYGMSYISTALNGSTYSSDKLEVITQTRAGINRVSDSYNSNNTSVSSKISGITKKSVSDLGLVKYDSARAAMESVFASDSSNIYGLHFMKAAISKTNLAVVPTAVINDQSYTNYEVPRNSIDFQLKEAGRINFFAGSYYSSGSRTNDSFFSLHQIYRDSEQKITDIKEISKIYSNGDGTYTYLYKGDTAEYSVLVKGTDANGKTVYSYDTPTTEKPSTVTDDNLVFDTDWLTEPQNFVLNAVYYYEIPANYGEYALGSVDGHEGCYLFYLDIAANAQTIERTVSTEIIKTTVSTYEYPTGVGFGSVEDAAVSLPFKSETTAGATDSSNVALEVDAAGAGCVYAKDGVTVTINNVAATATADSVADPTTRTIITTTDYNTSENTTTVQVQVGDIVDGKVVYKVVSTKVDGDERTDVTVPEKTTTSLTGYEKPIDNVTVVEYTYERPKTVTDVDIDARFTYQTYENYPGTQKPTISETDDITIKTTGDSITAKHFNVNTETSEKYTVKVNGTEVNSSSEVTVSPSS